MNLCYGEVLASCSTDSTEVKRDCPLLADAWLKLIEISGINVKGIEGVESYSFVWWISETIYELSYR